ncbi:MAG: hypothetical protein ACK481_01130 [Candidatus Melainabacteria bacterium]|jgi:hypothetical protein
MTIYLNLAVEDDLSEAVLRKVLKGLNSSFEVNQVFKKGGFGYLKKKIEGFNNAASFIPYLVLTDLDNAICPTELINDWLKSPMNPNLIFRVAVKEIESWVLADRESFAKYLGIPKSQIPCETDLLESPKKKIFSLVENCHKRDIRNAILPFAGAKIGPDYNGELIQFVYKSWNMHSASENSQSLRRIIQKLKLFHPLL